MRHERWILPVALVIATWPTEAESIPGLDATVSRRGSVEIRLDRRIELHPAHDTLVRECRADREVSGCTDFPVEILDCECEQQGGAWQMNLSAKLEAVTHLRNTPDHTRLMLHEALHVGDLERGLRDHLEALASRRFDSATSCRRFARVLRESPHLRLVMNRLRVESNAKFGCSRGGRPTPG